MSVYDFTQVLKNTHQDIKTAYLLKKIFSLHIVKSIIITQNHTYPF